MRFLFNMLFSIFQAIWRRLFGGWLAEIPYKDTNIQDYISKKFHISIRFLLEIIETVAVFLYMFLHEGQSAFSSVCSSLIMTLLFWLPSHGVYFDIGRDYPPDETTIERYNKQLSCKFLKFVFPKKLWYGKLFDFAGMVLRYGIPSLAMVPFSSIYVSLMGIAVALIYAICWNVCEKRGTNPTNFAEFLSGFATGLFL